MERSSSTSTVKFRNNYDALLKEVLEESSEDEEELLNQMDIDLTAATAELPDELRAALEDRSLADKYLANLKTFMSHRRTHSYSSMTSSKGDFSSPSTPMQTSFTQPMSPKPFFRAQQDPLSKLLDDVPYQTRLINGVESLTVLEQKFYASRIPELDLPSVSDTVIRARLDSLYKIQDDLFIHLHGGPLAKNGRHSQNIGEKKKQKVTQLLDDIAKEIGLYEEFVKKANYLSLENILNESDSSGDEYQDSEIFETDGSGIHFDSSSDISRTSPNTPASPSTYSSAPVGSFSSVSASLPATPRRTSASPYFSLSENRTTSSPNFRRIGSSTGESSTSHQSSDAGTQSDHSLSLSVLMNGTDSPQNESKDSVEPWEAFKWTPLLKISEQLYSDSVRKNSGLLTVLAVSGVIAIGTTRSLVFVYDYSQNLKCVLGDSARAVEVGSVTSLAISADHTTIACGYSQGYIIVWNIKKPAYPVRTIDPLPASQLAGALASNAVGPQQTPLRKEGHIKGAAILHIGFISIKKSEIVSADDQGMAFYHLLYKVVMVNAVDTTRILGRYQNISFSSDPAYSSAASSRQYGSPSDDIPVIPKPKKPSTVFGMQPLPLGHIPHPAESFGLVALLTPYKMIIVGLKPTPQTQFKFLKPKYLHSTGLVVNKDGLKSLEAEREESINSKEHADSLSGCLAWLPVTKTGMHDEGEPQDKKSKDSLPSTDPMLAFSWGYHLFIIRVGVEAADSKQQNGNRANRNPIGNKPKKGNKLEFIKLGEWECGDPIVGLQWINRQILVLFTPNEEMILFDPKNMRETERANIRNKQLVYHDWFNNPLKEVASETIVQIQKPALGTNNTIVTHKTIEMAYYHSLKGYKGKMFLLGLRQIFVGTLLSWADRILALVKAGDFLEGIELATLFYNGQRIQTVVGLPEDEQARKKLVGEKLMELLVASLNYAFSSKRTYEGMTDDIAGGNSILFHDLADGCMKACLSMGKLDFLFDTVYERFAASGVRGVFLEVLAPYIVDDKMPDIPPSIMKDLVEHYSEKKLLGQLEQVIWHVNPQCLSIDQIVSMCHREGLYEAMMYVWNKSMNDYVSPVVEMLKVIRRVLRTESQSATIEQANPAQRSRVSSGESRVWPRPSPENNLRQNTEKLFEYLKSVLRGRSFPDDLQMIGSRATEAKSAVYSFVFSGRCVVWPRIGGKLVLTTTEDEEMSEPTYPYLRLLLRFNTKKFLEALEVVFEDPWLNGGEDILTSTFEDELPGKVISRQIIVSTLLDVMGGGLSGSGLPPPPPRPKQSISTSTVQSFSVKGSDSTTHGSGHTSDSPANYDYASSDNLVQLYMFIANNLHKYTTFILLPPKTLNKILVRLAEEPSTDTREERQLAVQNLLNIYTPVNEEHMSTLYEEAGFWKVLTNVYRRDKKYGKLVEAYLKDDERRNMVFECVQGLLGNRSNLNIKQKNEVKSVIMIRISQFVEIDGQKTAFIIEKFFNNEHAKAIRLLEEDQELEEEEHHATADKRLFLYLRGLLEPEDDKKHIPKVATSDSHTRDSGMVYQHRTPNVDSAIQERYIELMCRFDPSGVYDYFSTKLGDNVNLDNLLKSCEEYNIIDAVVWIMEKKGDTKGALDTMLEVAKEKNTTILQIIKDHAPEDGKASEGIPANPRLWTFEDQSTISSCLIGLNGVLRVGTLLCENSSRMSLSTYTTEVAASNDDRDSISVVSSKLDNDEPDQNSIDDPEEEPDRPQLENDEVELLWFRLLDAYVEASIEIYGALDSIKKSSSATIPQGLHNHIVSSFKSFVQSILASLLLSTSPQVSLPRLLLRLIRSQTRGETTFADFRDILLSMLDTYKYEGKLLKMTNQLFDRDLYEGVQEMVRKKGRGWRPRRAVCEICGAAILDLSLLQRPLAWGFEGEIKCGHAYHRQCIELQLGTDHHVCTECHNGTSKGKSQPKNDKAKGKERAT
ncbi:Golgi CORVET complex core vacuolar protein 8-domain-containing protein [Phycomyces blakesleeanus]|uniref:Golgi CORVET complex core vacuolar protein 8-domain-containing protein n=1 Tax=Phycomyces blakesleeanus TaxID=4837 RepID=A0ABR3AVG2_PHYBL